MAQKVGHDLIIEVGQWQASVAVGEDGKPAAVSFQADPRSLQIPEGSRRVTPLTALTVRDWVEVVLDRPVSRCTAVEKAAVPGTIATLSVAIARRTGVSDAPKVCVPLDDEEHGRLAASSSKCSSARALR